MYIVPIRFQPHERLKKYMPILLSAIGLFLLSNFSFAQSLTRINLIKADSMVFKKALGPDLRRVMGHVVFEHDGAYLYCDSAYFFETSNNVEAFGKIHIKVSDTLNIYGDKLIYSGNTKIANLSGKVKMVDKQTTLFTDQLTYDRNTEIAYYNNSARIVSGENKLTSILGYYYTAKKEFFFKDKVVLTNPKYIINSDTLLYNTLSKTAFFKGPSTIKGEENFIYCENGWYNTANDKSEFRENAWFKNKDQKLSGDILYYDRQNGIGKAINNICLLDSARQVSIHGNLADYHEIEGYTRITDSAQAIFYHDGDSLFLHADTLFGTFDSLRNMEQMFAFHTVRFFRENLQGVCDTLHYNFADSSLILRKSPILWSGENQISADSIRMWMTNKEADSMMMYNTCFIISKARDDKFNQIKGKHMTGFFRDNELFKIKVLSNAETIYFVEEDNGRPIGVNYATSSEMEILLKDKEVYRIKYIGKPQESLKPEHTAKPQELILRGFEWNEELRPKDRFDIFHQ